MSRLSAPKTPHNPRSPLPVSRTARSLARPIKVDIPAGVADPLAPVVPWGVESPSRSARPANMADGAVGGAGWPGAADAPVGHIPLSDLVDKAGAQLATLRRTLDDAASADRVVRAHLTDLMQRMQQGQRFGAEFDQRLVNAGKAAGVLEKAAATLLGLEQVVEQIRSAQAGMEARAKAQMAEHEASVEARLDAATGRYESMLARIESAASAAEIRAAERIDELERGIKLDLDALTATMDRHAAQTQARASIILDSASDRLDTMDRQAQNLGGRAARDVDALCEKAARLLGHDPRNANVTEPIAGSLAHALARAEEIIVGVDQGALRIAAGRTAAEHTIEQLESARQAAHTALMGAGTQQAELSASIAAALAGAEAADARLNAALAAQHDAAGKSEQASALLMRQREDLAAIAEAGRYHVEQSRAAEAGLRAEIESASVRSAALQRAVADVNDQAANLVGLAKEVAMLVAKAEQVKGQ